MKTGPWMLQWGSPAEVAEALRKARELLVPEARWTRKTFYRDEKGLPCSMQKAVAYDPIGAVRASCGSSSRAAGVVDAAVVLLERALPDDAASVWDYNDFTATHADVLALFDGAIRVADGNARAATAILGSPVKAATS
jgi:hypothetical protein